MFNIQRKVKMSAKDCLVVVYQKDQEPYVVRDMKTNYFSKKEAQRQASVHVNQLGALKAEVVQMVMEVNPGLTK